MKETTKPKNAKILVGYQKPGCKGLSAGNIAHLMRVIKENGIENVFPIDIEAKEVECSFMGFISVEAANEFDYDYEHSGLRDYMDLLMNLPDVACGMYEYRGVKIIALDESEEVVNVYSNSLSTDGLGDFVKCYDCGALQLVRFGDNHCAKCGHENLQWVDKECLKCKPEDLKKAGYTIREIQCEKKADEEKEAIEKALKAGISRYVDVCNHHGEDIITQNIEFNINDISNSATALFLSHMCDTFKKCFWIDCIGELKIYDPDTMDDVFDYVEDFHWTREDVEYIRYGSKADR